MRSLVHPLLAALVMVLVGFGLSYLAVANGILFGASRWGPWQVWRDAGSPAPDPYTRAYIARSGILQLGRGEGVRLVANHDSAGHALSRNCRYLISGGTPVAAFWTLRAIAGDGTLIVPEKGSASFSSTRLSRNADGVAQIHAGRAVSPDNWLEITGNGSFQLVLTFYDASAFSGFGVRSSGLPDIVNEGCS